jgi:hypothetical protein
MREQGEEPVRRVELCQGLSIFRDIGSFLGIVYFLAR